MFKAVRIHVLCANNNPNSFSFVFPLFVNRRGLFDRGIDIKFFYSLKPQFYDCDIVFIDNKFFTYYWRRKEEAFKYLEKKGVSDEDIYKTLETAKKNNSAVLWFDNTDSTGTPQFEVLPYVDGYYKSQVLRERSAYCKEFYRSRIFFDYYHKRFGIIDDFYHGRKPVIDDIADIGKIHISWNPALNDHGPLSNSYSWPGRIFFQSRRYLPRPSKYTAKFINTNTSRRINITARVGLKHPRVFVRMHRGMLIERLREFNVDTRPVHRRAYYRELQTAKLGISPFGLGEITYRDFETILCGALLVKPDMGHLETWPDLYREDQTYVKCDWEFSDLNEKIAYLLSHPTRIHHIASEAQETYRYYLFGKGRDDFCDRIQAIVKRHVNPSEV